MTFFITFLVMVVVVLVLVCMYQKPKVLKTSQELTRLALQRANDKKPD